MSACSEPAVRARFESYIEAIRELVEELNAEAASGILTHRALVLTSRADQMTRVYEREIMGSA